MTQQLLCYALAGLEPIYPSTFIDSYRKGSAPNGKVSDEAINEMKEMAMSSIDRLELDLDKGLFKDYKEYQTSYGILLQRIEDAVGFLAVHEALHLGYAMALRKVI